ncbi:MAG: DUF1080 domain-containing protein [Cyclobacterium sp.]|uniref:3-keto-disaccharide hydrolase n=1 Tax=unclassified Cyclobacterium TaxID=2615055 RepID=UPI0013D684F8|nr:DUF1080 domain-containing protein [Cyclobacterium sp. SYSU L10401]
MQLEKFIYIVLIFLTISACGSGDRKEKEMPEVAVTAGPEVPNRLTEAEKAEEWELLFDGVSTQGWHGYLGAATTDWKVKDGVLYTDGGSGDLVTDELFSDFELKVDWKIETHGNSGIFYFVVESPEYPRIHHTGPEFQIIDDENYPQELQDNQKTGANSDVLAPSSMEARAPGNWNRTRIVSRAGKMEHWLNGKQILAFDANSPEWRSAVAASKFSAFDYAMQLYGKIGLQDHGGPVWFKNIKIRKL